MNKPTTLEGARRQIDQLPKAMSQAEVIQLSTMARAWIACLFHEGLIDQEAFRDLSIELNAQIDQAMTRFPGQRPIGE